MSRTSLASRLCLFLLIVQCPLTFASASPATDEILWDRYGVPHIYGRDIPAVFYGYGWAQAQSHANRILRLYGEARGRGAEYWGPRIRSDHAVGC